MMFKVLLLAAATAALGAGTARADNLILNGGFENGSYTATSSDSGATNGSVPVDWTANNAFIDNPGFNHVTSNAHTGESALSIGNFDNEDLAGLSQAFSDEAGQSYTVDFYAYDGGANGDANAFLTVSAGGQSTTFDDTVSSYTLGSFTFVGTGSDTLQIAAKTNPNEWFIDDVSVNGPAAGSAPVSAAPEPGAWALMLGGVGAMGLMLRRRRRAGATFAV